ncbi:MAG: 50S ribosomal protein L17 [Minisyncoccia bacterium]
MRHSKQGRKFGRKRGQRKAFIKSLVNNLITKEKILTTEARAKEIRMLAERLITYAKKQNLNSLRMIMKYLPKDTAYKLYHEIAPRYINRNGGYTKIIKLSSRRINDGAKRAYIELVK